MVDFGGEFVIENNSVPWLIWIQIIVLCLLFFVIYFAALSTSPDQPDTAAAGCWPSSSEMRVPGESKSVVKGNSSRTATNCLQVGENQGVMGEMVTNTRRRIIRGEDALERENSSAKERTSNFLHPCHYFRWARLAFLKCLGLDHDQGSSAPAEQRRES